MSEKIVRVSGLVIGLLLAVLAAIMTPAVARADGRATQLEAEVSAWVDGSVEVSGRLVDSSGNPVPGAPVVASVAGARVGSGTTAGDGSFQISFAMPAQYRTGTPQVDVSYAGDGTFAASADARRVDYGGQQQLGLAGNPGAEVAKLGDAQQSVLTINLIKATASPGDTVALSGTLSTAGGDAIANGTIIFALNGQQQADTAAVTSETGTFESFVEVPMDLAPGDYTVTASFAGSPQLQAATSEAALTVKAAAPAAPESEEAVTQPAETVETLGSATPQADPSTAQASAAPTAPTARTEGTPSIVTWAVIGGIVLASGTGLALILMALRPRRRPEPDTDSFIGDPEDPEAELLDGDEGWESHPNVSQPVGATEVIPLDESASAFAPPVTVRAMPRHSYREPLEAAAARAVVDPTPQPMDDGETVDVRNPSVPRRAAPS
ncbi:MAG: carboxypeptidase regulatory-like domain-containing protein [Propionibacteriaceae bacterium]|nr:carboxypeptidase regulatory-like domain-containing protein [Propionibacteriaceae bacterium]